MGNKSLPIVLVHGLFHGAWAWNRVAVELAALGRPSVAVDISGHGLNASYPEAARARPFDAQRFATEPSPLADLDLTTAADQLTAQIRRIAGGEPVLAVVHSMGGPILTRAVQNTPELFAHVVYLAAYMPASDTPAIAYSTLEEAQDTQFFGLLTGDPNTIGALRIDTASDDPGLLLAIRNAFYADVDSDLSTATISLLSCDAPVKFATDQTALTVDGWGSVDRTYVLCTEDHVIPPALQRLFIRQASEAFPDSRTDVVEIDSSHSPFLSMPDRVAHIVDSLR